jgi:sodium-dependent dicarboxylate transporter 2/3/5
MSIARLMEEAHPEHKTNFGLCMMLGIAYAASIGGVGTIIGTPPNGFLVAYIRETYGTDIGFADWLPIGLPLVAVFLPVAWLMLTRVVYPVPASRLKGAAELVTREYEQLGPTSRGEWAVFTVFMLTAVAWITRSQLSRLVPGISDAGIAMTAAVALFVIPVDRRRRVFVLDWATAARAPWGILILFGGGLSLAAAVQRHGVAELIGSQVAGLGSLSPILLVLIVTTLVIFLTELTSNTATTATLVPILAALAPALGVDPALMIVPAALAASCAFMMPVATPPNAIVFGSGYVSIPQMCKAGLWLNIIGIVLITALTFGIVSRVLSLS